MGRYHAGPYFLLMAQTTIEWTATWSEAKGRWFPGYTFNPWQGCVRVSPACKHCYAETLDNRFGGGHWGAAAPRKFQSDAYWEKPKSWNAYAKKLGVRLKVFCASMADVFESRPDLVEPRERLYRLIEETPWLDWLLLTKRAENISRMLPDRWYRSEPWMSYEESEGQEKKREIPRNVWLGTTAENQKYYDERMVHLLQLPATTFVSAEPLLGAIQPKAYCPSCKALTIDMNNNCHRCQSETIKPSWIITGGESGLQARRTKPEWFRHLRDNCIVHGVPFFFKQWGEWKAYDEYFAEFKGPIPLEYTYMPPSKKVEEDGISYFKVGKKEASNLLDCEEWKQTPASCQPTE